MIEPNNGETQDKRLIPEGDQRRYTGEILLRTRPKTPIADALDATHQELADTARTSILQAVTNAAKLVAKRKESSVKPKSGHKAARQKNEPTDAVVGSKWCSVVIIGPRGRPKECRFDSGSPKSNSEAASAMNMIIKKERRRSLPFRMSFLLGALFCAFLTTTEKAFSEIPLIAADLAWVAPPVLLANENFDSVTPTALLPGWSSTRSVTSRAGVPTPVLPTGVFSLTGFGHQIRGSTLSNPDVDGISVRDKWWHLEPSEGVYDWSTLDAYVAQINPTGKKILIRIGTMGGRHSLGGNMPDWVMDAVGADTITYYDSGRVLKTVPLFWDQTYLDKKKAMIAAIGARYSGNPLVRVATASFANRNSEDWSVPDSTQIDGIPPAGSSEASRMLAAGYTHQKMVDAGTQIMDAAMAAWPNQAIYLAIGRIDRPLEQDPDSVARDVRDATRSRWGANRLVIGKEIISNVMPFAPPDPTSAWALFYNSRPAIAGQNLWACYGDPHCRMNGGNCNGLTADQILRGTVDHFVSYGGKWLEIYDDDVTNLPGAIHYAHQLIGH